MRVTVLGSGTLVPNGRRGPAGYAVESDGATVLVDGGSGTLRRLAEAGIDYRCIDHLFYTHIHPDHTGDLVPLLFAQRYTPDFVRRGTVQVYGPRGFAAFFERLRDVYGKWLGADGDDVIVTELWGDAVRAPGLRVETAVMEHSVACIGYRFEGASGGRAVYTGDTDDTPAIAELGRGVDVLIADCSAPDDAKMAGHATPAIVGRRAAEAGARLVVLSHLYPHCEDVDLVAACRRHFDGAVHVAHDLMQITIVGERVDVGRVDPQVWPTGWQAPV